MSDKGFVVNTDIEETVRVTAKRKAKFNLVRFLKRNCVYVAATALLFVVLFCAVIPVCKEYRVYSKTATGADGNIIEIDYFNSDGLIEKNEKYTDGELYSVTENTYKKGRIIENKVYYWDELFETVTYNYNGKKLNTKITNHQTGLNTLTEAFYYDEDGVLINSVVTDETGAQRFRYDYTYEKGNLVKKALYDIENDYTRVTTYNYEDGRLVSENTVAGAYHNSTIEYSYNSKGYVSMQKNSATDQEYISYTYEYKIKRVSVFGKIF